VSRIDESKEFIATRIAVLTVSDTRQLDEDKSGQTLVDRLERAGHALVDRKIIADERDQIADQLRTWIADPNIDVVISTGGTGLTGRDVTVEAHRDVYEKEIDAFGTVFTIVSMQKNWHLGHSIARNCRRGRGDIFICATGITWCLS